MGTVDCRFYVLRERGEAPDNAQDSALGPLFLLHHRYSLARPFLIDPARACRVVKTACLGHRSLCRCDLTRS